MKKGGGNEEIVLRGKGDDEGALSIKDSIFKRRLRESKKSGRQRKRKRREN